MPFRDACKISKSSKQWNVTKCATCRQSICTLKVISLRDKSVFFRSSTCKPILQTFTYPKPLYEPSDKTTLLLDAYNAWTAEHTNWQSKNFSDHTHCKLLISTEHEGVLTSMYRTTEYTHASKPPRHHSFCKEHKRIYLTPCMDTCICTTGCCKLQLFSWASCYLAKCILNHMLHCQSPWL